MDYEKKYKEKLEAARYWHDASEGDIPAVLEEIFSELKESEDERIKKSIIEHLKCDIDDMAKSDNAFEYEAEIEELSKYIAWLEKQDEKKPAFEMKTPEESLCIDSDTYNKIVDECVYGEQNPAWSEEDELRMENILSVIEGHGYPMEVEWLKSIKCKSTWKPSDVQLRALKEACDEHWEPDGSDPLYALYQNLKKLREE